MVENGQEATKTPSQPSEAELRQFAAEKSPEELKRIEEEKARLETQYEERQLEVSEKAERLQEKIKRREQELVEIYIEIERLKEELDAKQASTVAKIFNVLEVRSLRKEIGTRAMEANDLQREFDGLWMLYDDLQKEARSRVEIDEAERMVGEFYADQTQKLEAHEKDSQARDVSNVSRKYNAVLTHSFISFKDPGGPVSVIKPGTTWKQMLESLLVMQPPISTATVRQEWKDEKGKVDEPFFEIGVVIGGGNIKEAFSGDIGSHVSGGERTSGRGESANIERDIEDSVVSNKKGGRGEHNEVLVRNPEISGLFVTSEVFRIQRDGRLTESGNRNLVEDMLAEAQKLKVPLYYHDKTDGNYYVAEGVQEDEYEVNERDLSRPDSFFYKLNQALDCLIDVLENNDWTGTMKIRVKTIKRGKKPLSVDEILANRVQITEEDKQEMAQDLLGGEVFNIDCTERDCFDCHSYGVGLYEKITDSARQDDSAFFYRIDKTYGGSDDGKEGYIRIAPNISFGVGVDCKDFDSYLFALEEVSNHWGYLLKEANEKGDERYVKSLNDTLKKVGWHLWGLAEVAQKRGDEENYKKARALAESIVGLQEHDDLVERRVDESGQFKFNPADLKNIRTNF